MKKRIFSLTLASVMALSMSVPAFASELTELDENGEAEVEVQATSSILYADLKVGMVDVPTSEAFDFYLDPNGLADLANGESVLVQELGTGNRILGGAPVPIVNNSTHPVTVEIAVEGEITGGTDPGFAATAAALTGDKALAFLHIMPSATPMLTSNNFTEADKVIPIDTDDVEFTLELPASLFKVTNNNGSYDVSELVGTARGNGLLIDGQLNSDFTGDWSEVEIAINFAFDIKEVATLSGANSTGVTAYGMSGSAISSAVSATLTNRRPYPTAVLQTMSTATGADVSVKTDLGAGTSKATAVDTARSTVGMVFGGDYVEMSFNDLIALNFATFTPTGTTANTLKLTKALFLELNNNAEVSVYFRYTDASSNPMDYAPMARVLKKVA